MEKNSYGYQKKKKIKCCPVIPAASGFYFPQNVNPNAAPIFNVVLFDNKFFQPLNNNTAWRVLKSGRYHITIAISTSSNNVICFGENIWRFQINGAPSPFGNEFGSFQVPNTQGVFDSIIDLNANDILNFISLGQQTTCVQGPLGGNDGHFNILKIG